MFLRDLIVMIVLMVGNVMNDLASGVWRREDGEFVMSMCMYCEFFKKCDMEFLMVMMCCFLDVDVWFLGLDVKSAMVTFEFFMARGDLECRIFVCVGEK